MLTSEYSKETTDYEHNRGVISICENEHCVAVFSQPNRGLELSTSYCRGLFVYV